jgi:hypothetical protein
MEKHEFRDIEKLKEDIINNLDFREIRIAMEALNWTWEKNGKKYLPSIKELIESVEERMDDVYQSYLKHEKDGTLEDGKKWGSNSGGFHVYYHGVDEYGPNGFSVKFVVEEWHNFY